ncbi:MAG: hypothetical protein RL757_1943 [Bacteroidota bacterium]
MSRRKIVAGNWKMNKTQAEAQLLAGDIAARELPKDVTVVLCPPSVYLDSVSKILNGKSNSLHAGAQNCHHERSGAYTGEVSADMLKSMNIEYCIIGHSERREYYKETTAQLVKKVDIALSLGITPLFCCGEPLRIREKNTHARFVQKQIREALFHLSHEEMKKVVIAYEPIWAIGTGLTASPEQAQEMHANIRKAIEKKYGREIAQSISILYGGSCNAANAATLFALEDVDGGLIGGASLKGDDFFKIISAF